MKRPQPPAPETAGPRNDFGPRTDTDFGPREVLAIAAALQAHQRARLARLSPAGRLRKWGGV